MPASKVTSKPLEDVIDEARRIGEAAEAAGLQLKLVGGAAVRLHSATTERPPLRRRYGDLDFVASSKQRGQVQKLFESLGYQGDLRFNTLNGHQRLLYLDPENGRQVDIFIDVMRMCHTIDLRSRLNHAGPTLTPADLLLSKMQIYEINKKDVVDITALFLDHDIGEDDNDRINATYLAGLAAGEWGLYRTLQLNAERLRAAVDDLAVAREIVLERLERLRERIEDQPKSLKWKVRARVGDRVSWYELPEEVRQPYQAE
ncbi:MAG TPA: hypothetical protein VET65_02775 [Candidatus Limnocylindrales bacterium]|nr:hypothetical protein [Candidatus Limnocylindrales bacterium]